MNNFSFNATAGASQSTAKPRLAGNNIYDVKFDGCEVQDIVGVKDPTMTYKVLKLKFSNEDGTFEHTVFEPRAEDFDRRVSDYNNPKTGKVDKIPQASNVESMMLLFKHVIDSVDPATAEKIDKKQTSLGATSWDDLRALIVKILDAKKGASAKIKLMKNSKTGEATFPGFFTGLTKEGVPYVKNNFIGPKVSFSTYEMKKISDEASAKPTKATEFALAPPEPESQDDLVLNFNVSSEI